VLSKCILTCPRCGNSGAMYGAGAVFEDVWPVTRGHLPVRQCKECGAGIIVRPKFVGSGTRASLIADDTWGAMKAALARRPADDGTTR
jgi:hypothetical protein